MRPKEIRDLSAEELGQKETELREELLRLRLRRGTGPLPAPMRPRNARKDLARMMTIARERRTKTGE